MITRPLIQIDMTNSGEPPAPFWMIGLCPDHGEQYQAVLDGKWDDLEERAVMIADVCCNDLPIGGTYIFDSESDARQVLDVMRELAPDLPPSFVACSSWFDNDPLIKSPLQTLRLEGIKGPE